MARLHPQFKNTCPLLEIVENSARTLKSHDSGSAKTWVQRYTARTSKKNGETDKYAEKVFENRMLDCQARRGTGENSR